MKLYFFLTALAAVHAKTDRETKTKYRDTLASDLETESFWERELQSSISKFECYEAILFSIKIIKS